MKQLELHFASNNAKSIRKIAFLLAVSLVLFRRAIGKQKRGKKRLCLKKVFQGMFYRLTTGCAWRKLPVQYGKWRSVYGWQLRIVRSRILETICGKLQKAYVSIKHNGDLKRIIFDGSLVRSSGKLKISKSSPRRGRKRCVNRQIVVDRRGVPIACKYAPGTAHDSRFCIPLIQKCLRRKLLKKGCIGHGDKGFDSIKIRLFGSRKGLVMHIPMRKYKHDPVHFPHKDSYRYKVEAANSWLNAFRALGCIREQSFETLNQLTFLAIGIITMRFMTFKSIKTSLRTI